MLKKYLQSFFQNKFYPTNQRNWYQEKGYYGEDMIAIFADFLQKQRQVGAIYYHLFQNINLTRRQINSGSALLDSVIFEPDSAHAAGKAGTGKYIILFQGRGEYYEARFRDAAMAARITGANILVFNPKGLNQSSGETKLLTDLVNDAIAVINYLLVQNIPAKNIILQGNSLGAAVQALAALYFQQNYQLRFRQINSNSFKNLASVIAQYYHLSFTEYFWHKLLTYSGWEITPSQEFYQTGPYRIYLRRKNDQTLKGNCQFHYMVDQERDYKACPAAYREINHWLNSKNQLIYLGPKQQDTHKISLSEFTIDEPAKRNVFELINIFIAESEEFI